MKYKLLLVLSLLLVFFQNFNFVNLFDKRYFIDEESRKVHAKEILGSKYKKSPAAKIEGEKFIHVYIFDIVQTRLPQKYKSKAKDITRTIINESKKHEIDPLFVMSVIITESSFNPEAKGLAGEIGLMQLMPVTGKDVALKMKLNWKGDKTLKDPIKNIRIGTAYLSQLRSYFENNPNRYISAYNSGPGKIRKIENKQDLPKFYSGKILKYYEQLYQKIVLNKVPDNLAYN
jgi:soluble lytic murein transglycosylase